MAGLMGYLGRTYRPGRAGKARKSLSESQFSALLAGRVVRGLELAPACGDLVIARLRCASRGLTRQYQVRLSHCFLGRIVHRFDYATQSLNGVAAGPFDEPLVRAPLAMQGASRCRTSKGRAMRAVAEEALRDD